MSVLTTVLRLDESVLASPDWTFRQPEEGMLCGEKDGVNYLLVSDLRIDTLAAVQVDYEYLTRVKKVSCQGAALVSGELYYQILENLTLSSLTDNQSKSTEIQRQLEDLLTHATSLGASDVHITRREAIATVELRINGVLIPDEQMLSTKCDEMVFVLYNVQASTKETTWNRSVPQSANILYTLAGRKYRFRYAHFPIFGETEGCYHAVLRIIPSGVRKSSLIDLREMGISDAEALDMRRMLSNPYGAYLVSGTTGSGKSTTLKVLMEWMQHYRYDDKGSFLTIEDPVEYQIAGARQSSVLDADDGGFHIAIKSALRRDPDVLMVGEIRDPISANALSGAVESGHYCFTTVHAGNIVTLLQRLSALGMTSDKLSTPGFIAGLQCQKLLPVLCDHCKKPHSGAVLGGRTFDVYERNRDGCEKCNYSGISARQLVIEYMRPTDPELEAISRQDWYGVYSQWRKKRHTVDTLAEGFDLREKAVACVLAGRVCVSWFSLEFGDVEPENLEVLLGKIH
ncbi:TPA: ATPase, T2SS/T4P/T4SS family [Salmonella enterica]